MAAIYERLEANVATKTTPLADPALILVVDDDDFFREGVVSFLRRNDLTTLEAADAESAYALAVQHRPGAAVVDIMLPERPDTPARRDQNQGIDLVRRLKRADPTLAVVVLSAFGDRSEALLRLALEGVRGVAYLVKGCPARLLLQGLEEARAGHIMIKTTDPGEMAELAEKLWSHLTPPEREYVRRAVELFPMLTEREQAVALELAHAQTVEGVAVALNIAVTTAEKHIHHLYAKLGLDEADQQQPPLRKSLLLAKACWLLDMLGYGQAG